MHTRDHYHVTLLVHTLVCIILHSIILIRFNITLWILAFAFGICSSSRCRFCTSSVVHFQFFIYFFSGNVCVCVCDSTEYDLMQHANEKSKPPLSNCHMVAKRNDDDYDNRRWRRARGTKRNIYLRSTHYCCRAHSR